MIDPGQLVGLAGIPLVVALVQLVKLTWPRIPSHWWPMITLILAVSFNSLVAAWARQDVGVAALVGLIVGLSASGLYSYATVQATPARSVGGQAAPKGYTLASTPVGGPPLASSGSPGGEAPGGALRLQTAGLKSPGSGTQGVPA